MARSPQLVAIIMKESWEKIGTEIHNVKSELETLCEMLPQSAKMHKQVSILNKTWKKLQHAANDFDQFVTPVKSVKVTSPFLEDADFTATWKMWKEYLVEQHGIHMRSRAELKGLKRMVEISDNSPKTAVRYLEFYMARMDKGYYKVNETDVPQPGEKQKPAGTGIKLTIPPWRKSAGNSSPHRGEVSGEKRDGGVKQKTLQEEIEEYKQSKQKKS